VNVFVISLRMHCTMGFVGALVGLAVAAVSFGKSDIRKSGSLISPSLIESSMHMLNSSCVGTGGPSQHSSTSEHTSPNPARVNACLKLPICSQAPSRSRQLHEFVIVGNPSSSKPKHRSKLQIPSDESLAGQHSVKVLVMSFAMHSTAEMSPSPRSPPMKSTKRAFLSRWSRLPSELAVVAPSDARSDRMEYT